MTGVITRVASATARSTSLNLTSLSKAYNALPRLQRAFIASRLGRLGSKSQLARAYATAATTKTTTKKPASKSKATASKKKPTAVKAKKAAKAAPKKKKKVAKKPVVKKRKVLSEKQKTQATRDKAKAEIADLRLKTLTLPPTKPTSAITLYALTQKGKGVGVVELSKQYKELSESEKEKLARDAEHNKMENHLIYNKWILEHTPEQIKDANAARASLRRRIPLLYPQRKASGHNPLYSPLKDDRQVKRPLTAYNIYFAERIGSGSFSGQPVTQSSKLVGAEYKELDAAEKKKYTDLADADKARYTREYTDTFGQAPKTAVLKKTSA